MEMCSFSQRVFRGYKSNRKNFEYLRLFFEAKSEKGNQTYVSGELRRLIPCPATYFLQFECMQRVTKSSFKR